MARSFLLVPVYLLCAALPLLSPVGENLEYEYALAASWLTLLLVPLYGALVPPRFLPVEEGVYRPRVAAAFLWAAFVGPLVALVPAGLMFLVAGCPCSRTGFGFWAASLWLPAWTLAHAAMHGIMRARAHRLPRWAAVTGVVALLVVAFGWTTVELWTNPQKRTVSLVAGFLHGPIYDDWIAFDTGLMLARAAHLAFGCGLLFLVFASLKRYASLAGGLLLTVAAGALLFVSSDFYSTKNKKKDLDELMYSALPGDGFIMRFRPPRADKDGDDEVPEKADADKDAKLDANVPAALAKVPIRIQRLHRDAQFHVRELRQQFGEASLPLVEIYVYPNEDLKKLWFGGGSTDVTDVVTPSIHITESSWPHPTLRHELVHALASGFGYHGIGFHPNIAFTEGLAVAMAPGASTLSLDDSAAALVDTPRLPSVESLFTPAFWKVSGGRAYTVAGSLIKHLIDKHGIDGVKKMYAGASWDEAFSESREAIVKGWREKVVAGYDKDRNAMFAEALFRYPGILDDACPHSKADLSRNRKDNVFVRMRQPIGWNPDTDYLEWLQGLDPDDKDVRLRSWRREIRKAATDRFLSEGRLATWRETLAKARTWPPEALEDVEMALLESDLARLNGEGDASRKLLEDLSAAAKKKFFGESLSREIGARLALEGALEPAAAGEWRKYLAGWRKGLPEVAAGSPWILSYLRLRNEKEGKYEDADLPRLLTVEPDNALPKTFHFEWHRTLANRLMRAGQFKHAATAFERAAGVANSGSKEAFAEHARRAKFYDELGPLRAASGVPAQTSL